jgi:hypothetical protein
MPGLPCIVFVILIRSQTPGKTIPFVGMTCESLFDHMALH